MAVQRKRFRVEEILNGGTPVITAVVDDAPMPVHREIMAELRAIRQQMEAPSLDGPDEAAGTANDGTTSREVAEAQMLLQTYRAQIEQCEKLKTELDLIYDAISRTKQEIAVLHGKSFSGDEMAKVTDELGAVVGGTEQATQQILEAAEAIDQSASALSKAASPEQARLLSEEIQERVISIFEACNFQDLTGQRVSKAVTTLRFIEEHIDRMLEIWQKVEQFKPIVPDDRNADDEKRFLNGPKLAGDGGHSTQSEIDRIFVGAAAR